LLPKGRRLFLLEIGETVTHHIYRRTAADETYSLQSKLIARYNNKDKYSGWRKLGE
jgi:hypothetical protein